MRLARLVRRSLRHYGATHAAVVLGVAVAVAVLGGALLVGASVQDSLRALALERLGRADTMIGGTPFFRERLADDLSRHPAFAGDWKDACPLLVLEGVVEHEASRRRAARVAVYGVDERFWQFHEASSRVRSPRGREALVSRALAAELGVTRGEGVILTVEQPSAIPAGTLPGRREGNARSIRLTVRKALGRAALGDFALRPQQAAVRAVFLPLPLLQRHLDIPGKVNALLLSRAEADVSSRRRAERSPDVDTPRLTTALRETFDLEDVGLRVRPVENPPAIIVESDSGYLSDPIRHTVTRVAAEDLKLDALPVLTYLANTIRVDDREVPYSVVSALDLARYSPASPSDGADASTVRPRQGAIWLNAWAVRELRARPGDRVSLEYYVWSDDEGLRTRATEFTYEGEVPMSDAGGDRTLTPEYPGLTDEVRMGDWDPPFPVDLRRVRPADEDYWNRYRATPKAFVSLADGQRLWASRHGRLTSLRLKPPRGDDPSRPAADLRARLRQAIDPVAIGALALVPLRADAERAAAGTTDFGLYFVYFSVFLLVSGLLLAGLFFRLGVEQRLREIGLLRAIGFPERVIRLLLLGEGVSLAAAGAIIGTGGALAYAALILHGLRTWWADAVGTTALVLRPHVGPLAAGAAAGIAIAPFVIALTLRRLVSASPRRLIAGSLPAERGGATVQRASWLARIATVSLGLGSVILGLALLGRVGRVAAFFAAGALFLLAGLAALGVRLRAPVRAPISGHGWWPVARLGARAASHRPGRAVLSVALIASATFIIVAVGAFRRDASGAPAGRRSGTGGYALMAESLVPVHYDLGTRDGRASLGLGTSAGTPLDRVDVARFRLRDGDDGSCLTLYRPTRPRILGAPRAFVEQGRFAFSASLASTPEEARNPWRLLGRRFEDGAVPAIGDANSLGYAFHLGLGDDFVLPREGAPPVRLRIVAALADSVFQSELVVAEEHFTALFPHEEGFRSFLVDTQGASPEAAAEALEAGLGDYGLDVTSTTDRLATFHRVENTYLTTFQTLGALGLLLGTLGVGVVLFRNVLEGRRELGVLRAVGFGERHVSALVAAESALLVALGAALGATCALVSVAPAIAERRSPLPVGWLALLLAAVVATSLLSAIVAAAAARRFSLIGSLRTE